MVAGVKIGVGCNLFAIHFSARVDHLLMSSRKARVVALAVFAVLMILALHHTTRSRVPTNLDTEKKAQTLLTSNSLIDSNNDDKVDAAINHQISQLGTEDEAKPETKPEAAETGEFDPAKELVTIRALSPVVIFSKTTCPFSKRLKALLHDNYQITPQPAIVELDRHTHGAELQKYLAEVSGRRTVPNVLVGKASKSRGGSDDMMALHESGELVLLLIEWGEKLVDVKQGEAPSNV